MIAHLVLVRYGRERRVLHDGHHRDEEGVGAAYDRGQLRPEERLQQRVDAGDEQQRLHHPHPVSLQPIRDGKPRTHQTLLALKLVTPGANPWGVARIKKRRGALTSLPPIMGTSTEGIMTAVPSARM